MTDTLSDFLLARLDEDEAAARAAAGEGQHWEADSTGGVWADDGPDPVFPVVYNEGRPTPDQAAHIARHDPARVLAVCAAKRAVIKLHVRGWRESDDPDLVKDLDCACCDDAYPCLTLCLLAQPYSGHPDFDSAWLVD